MQLIRALEGPNGCVTVVIKLAARNALIFQLCLIRPYSHSTLAAGAFPVMPDKYGRQTLSSQALPAEKKSSGGCPPLLSGFVPSPRYFAKLFKRIFRLHNDGLHAPCQIRILMAMTSSSPFGQKKSQI
jgi:hypothetical protein